MARDRKVTWELSSASPNLVSDVERDIAVRDAHSASGKLIRHVFLAICVEWEILNVCMALCLVMYDLRNVRLIILLRYLFLKHHITIVYTYVYVCVMYYNIYTYYVCTYMLWTILVYVGIKLHLLFLRKKLEFIIKIILRVILQVVQQRGFVIL